MVAVACRSADTFVRGIHLSSRYDKPHEIEHMRRVVEAMRLGVFGHIQSIWCDSKACAFYFVTAKSSTPLNRAPYDRIPEKIAKEFTSAGGYNGVQVSIGSKTFDFGPSWPDEDLERSG